MARIDWLLVTASLLIVIGMAASAAAQAPPQGPQVVSPEVTIDRRIMLPRPRATGAGRAAERIGHSGRAVRTGRGR